MSKKRIGYVERDCKVQIPELLKNDVVARRRNGAEWVSAKSDIDVDGSERFEHWIIGETRRRKLGPVETLEQFQRLGASLGREEYWNPLLVLEQVSFLGSTVAVDAIDEFCDDLERGLGFIASIDTQAWELQRDGCAETRLVLSPEGVCLHRWRGGGLYLFPEGLRVTEQGVGCEVGRLEDGVVYSPDGDVARTTDVAKHALARFARLLVIEPRPPETPFVEFVGVLTKDRSEMRDAGVVLFYEWAPTVNNRT